MPSSHAENTGHGPARLVLAAVAMLVLAGCGFSPVCSNEGQPYLEAGEVPPLKVPGGLDAANRSAGLAIPPPAAEDPTRAAQRPAMRRGCLDEPPSYFGNVLSPLASPEEVVAMWAQAWADRNTELLMAAYGQGFEAPDGSARAAWLEQRREQVATGPVPRPEVQDLRVTQPDPDRRVIAFTQRFDANAIRRELTLARESGFWRIVAERAVDVQ